MLPNNFSLKYFVGFNYRLHYLLLSSMINTMCSKMGSNETFKVLLGCTASKESSNVISLVDLLQGLKVEDRTIEVEVVATTLAEDLIPVKSLKDLCKMYNDTDEWKWWEHKKEVLHIQLRRWADIFLIAPMDADTLGRIVTGLCDNLLTCIVRAWDFKKPLIFCPAMNRHMWNHPITATHVSKLKEYGYIEIPCKTNNESIGEMADISVISQKIEEILCSYTISET